MFCSTFTSIDRASFPIPLSDWGRELIQPSLLAVLVVLGEGVPEKSGAMLEVQVPPGKGTVMVTGHSQAPRRGPRRKPLTERCPGARDSQ